MNISLDSIINKLQLDLNITGTKIVANGLTTLELTNVHVTLLPSHITERKYDEKELHLEFNRVVSRLPIIAEQFKKDKYTRQAICINWKSSKMPACNVMMQFIYRQGKLHLINYLRSSDITRLKNDIISLKYILNKLSKMTSMKSGNIYLNIASLHKYV